MQSTQHNPHQDRLRVARAHGVNVAPSVRAPRAQVQMEPTKVEFPNVAARTASTR